MLLAQQKDFLSKMRLIISQNCGKAKIKLCSKLKIFRGVEIFFYFYKRDVEFGKTKKIGLDIMK